MTGDKRGSDGGDERRGAWTLCMGVGEVVTINSFHVVRGDARIVINQFQFQLVAIGGVMIPSFTNVNLQKQPFVMSVGAFCRHPSNPASSVELCEI